MTQPAGDGAQSGATGTQSGTDSQASNAQPNANAGQPAQSGEANQATTTEGATVSRADYEALQRRLSAADKNNADFQTKLKAIEDAKLSDAEKTAKALEEAQKALAKKDEEIKEGKIRNAFLTDNTYDWHDSRAALKLADLSGVELKEDGTVTGLKEALKAVADANPWMLKAKVDGDEDGKDGKNKTGGTTGVGGTSGTNASGADQAGLRKRFPQLAGRVS